MQLTETYIKKLPTKEKDYFSKSENGLCLRISKTGRKTFTYRYRYDGKEKRITIGNYPDCDLTEARIKASEYKKRLSQGQDIETTSTKPKDNNSITFKDGYDLFVERIKNKTVVKGKITKKAWSDGYKLKIKQRFNKHIFPIIGKKAVGDINKQDVEQCFATIIKEQRADTATRIFNIMSEIFRFLIARDYLDKPPHLFIRQELPVHAKEHYKSITCIKKFGGLIYDIKHNLNRRHISTRNLLLMLAYCPLRQGLMRRLEWDRLNWQETSYEFTALEMKAARPFVMVFSKQAMAILEKQYEVAKRKQEKYIFFSPAADNPYISDTSARKALATIGYKNTMGLHGFRSSFRTIADHYLTPRYNFEWTYLERCLDHDPQQKEKAVKTSNLGSTYERDNPLLDKIKLKQELKALREIMQRWADYVDTLYANHMIDTFGGGNAPWDNLEELYELYQKNQM